MGMCFGTFSAPDVRMQAHGSVYPLFVAQNHVVWYTLCLQCERAVSIKDQEVHDGNKVQDSFKLREASNGHIKLTF